MMLALVMINAVASLVLEIALLLAFAWIGGHIVENDLLSLILIFVFPAIFVAMWAWWAAPKSKHRLHQPWLSLLEIALTVLATSVLLFKGQTTFASVLIGLLITKLVIAPALYLGKR